MENLRTKEKKSLQEGLLLSQIGREVHIEDDGTGQAPADATLAERVSISRLPVDMHSPAQILAMLSKARWIAGLKQSGHTTRDEIEEINLTMLKLQPTLPESTIRFTTRTIKESWITYERNGEDPRVLIPNFAQRGAPGVLKTCPIAESLLQKRFKAEHDKDDMLLASDVWDGHVADVTEWNKAPGNRKIEPISERTVLRRYHKEFTRFEIIVRNRSLEAARRELRDSGVRIKADEPLMATQWDDTDGEVFLIDERTGLPWGRANLTLGIDENTLSILGKEISEQARNVWSAASALINGILPKNMADPEYELCENPWYAFGKICVAQFDNAMYNRSPQFLEGVIADAGALPGWSKKHTPTEKSQIENLNDVIKTDFTPGLPGWRGPKRDRDGLKEGPGTAVCTLQTYRKHFNKWACDRYSNNPRTQGKTPKQKWNAHFGERRPPMPLDISAFKLIATLRKEYTPRASGGILRLGLRYNSPELQKLRKRMGNGVKFETRIHPFDLSKAYVLHPELGIFLTVPCIEDLDYIEGLSDRQQSLILKKCRQDGIKNPSIAECGKAKDDLRKLAEQLRNSTKLTEAKKGQRMDPPPPDGAKAPPSPAKPPEPQVAPTLMSELERQIVALSQVRTSDNDEGHQDELAP